MKSTIPPKNPFWEGGGGFFFFAPQKNSCGSSINPQKIPFGKNFRPKKSLGLPVSKIPYFPVYKSNLCISRPPFCSQKSASFRVSVYKSTSIFCKIKFCNKKLRKKSIKLPITCYQDEGDHLIGLLRSLSFTWILHH